MRPIASLPHPTSEVVAPVSVGGRTILVMTREWFRKLSEGVDKIQVTGTVAFAAATTAAVTFETPELSTDYNISYDLPEDRRVWTTSKATTGFTANVSASSSATYGWNLTRR